MKLNKPKRAFPLYRLNSSEADLKAGGDPGRLCPGPGRLLWARRSPMQSAVAKRFFGPFSCRHPELRLNISADTAIIIFYPKRSEVFCLLPHHLGKVKPRRPYI